MKCKLQWRTNAAFTLNGFDDQGRSLTFVKASFQVLKLKFYVCNIKQAFYPLYKLYISRNLDSMKILLFKLVIRYMIVKTACVNAAFDRCYC